jgi:AraC-like DNA-binding protein
VSDRGHWSYSPGKLILQPQPHVPPWLWSASAEFGVVYAALRLSELVANPVVLTIEVPWCAPPWAELYPYPTVFGAPAAALTLDPAAMLAPSRRADALVATLLSRASEQALATMPAGPPLQRQVQAAIMELVVRGLPAMVDVARRLGVTERTLRRRLQDEGISFRELREQTLLTLACEQLASSDLTITEIAFATGFSELSAFHRAFVRWTGLTPTAWRDNKRGVQRTAGADRAFVKRA